MADDGVAAGRSGGIYLNPGDFRFFCPSPGQVRPTRLHTLLGSCVSIIVWHPERGIGGMSHIILPERIGRATLLAQDGRYCGGAIALFRQEIARAMTMPQQYMTYLVGGGQMYSMPGMREEAAVGERNVQAARLQLQAAGFLIRAEDVGLEGHRKVELDLSKGEVIVSFGNRRRVL